jgi:hypothetical protein
MNMKNAIMTITLSVIAVLAIASITGLNNAFAEDETTYKMADDIYANFTFTFKDGVEFHEFPVFKMGDNYVNKNVSPSFSVEGVVGESPHLHKALDDAFKYKANPSYQWDYQLFDIDIDFIKNGTIMMTVPYHDCHVDDYKVETLTDDYESYMSSKTGFAIIDQIDFQCSGLNSITDISNDRAKTGYTFTEYDHTPYGFAEDVRTFITFEFDEGFEKIEFPYFQTNSGFEESTSNVIPGFSVESTIKKYLLLDKAIEKSRSNSGETYGVNVDFEATVEITKGDDVLRTIEYKDCRVSGAEITTLFDKEEGFTGKSGFAFVEQIDFECIGLDTVNSTYEKTKGATEGWRTIMTENILPSHEYPLGTGPRAIATFTYDNGVEVIDFPIFDQSDVFGKSGASFELEGVVGDFPMLYNSIEDNLKLTSTTGANNFLDLFQVDIELMHGDKVIRGFNYVDCRVVDYNVKTQRDKEESYFKGFALSNTFEFECQGYHPNNPLYDAMFNTYESAKTTSSNDLRETHDWEPGFYVQ